MFSSSISSCSSSLELRGSCDAPLLVRSWISVADRTAPVCVLHPSYNMYIVSVLFCPQYTIEQYTVLLEIDCRVLYSGDPDNSRSLL